MENLDTLLPQMAFLHEVDKLKYITRKTRLFHSDRHENDAEHSWHLMVMALVLVQHANEPVDILKVLKMLLIHDLVEIDAGDTFLFDAVLNHTNTEAERKAAERIFGLLPDVQATEFIAIWEEFEAGQTAEARYARAVDRLEPILQNVSNGGGTWKEHDIPHEKVIQKTQHIQHGAAALWDFAKAIIDKTAESGIIRKEAAEVEQA